jgi:hypothetical protein
MVLVACAASAAPARAEEPSAAAKAAALSAEDVQALRDLAAYLDVLAADTRERSDVRQSAIQGVTRIHEALGDWSDPAVLAWYERLLSVDRAQGRGVEGAILDGAQTAARAGQPHCGGMRAFWERFLAGARASGGVLPGVQREYEAAVARLERLEKPRRMVASGAKPTVLRVVTWKIARLLKPYPEPKAAPRK